MGNPNVLSRPIAKEKFGIDTHFFDRGKQIDIENNLVWEGEDVKDVEVEGIIVVI